MHYSGDKGMSLRQLQSRDVMEYTVNKQPHSGNNVKIHYEEEESKMEEDNEEFERENDEYYDKHAPNTTGKKLSRKFNNDASPGLNSEE